MDERQALEIFDAHSAEAIHYAARTAQKLDCKMCRDCHVVLLIDPSASLYAPFAALCRMSPDPRKPIVAALSLDAIVGILDAHGLDGAQARAGYAQTGAAETLFVGVVDAHVFTASSAIPGRPIAEA